MSMLIDDTGESGEEDELHDAEHAGQATADDLAAAEVESALYIPFGRRLKLRRRGTTFVREMEGPPGAPTVLLLHGWMATSAINWFRVFPELRDYRVLAIDTRGHGRGIKSRRRFKLADAADDAAAVLAKLDAGPAIVVGYSLGGPIAQLLWKRHPDKVAGLVLSATSHRLMPGPREAAAFSSMMALAAGTTRAAQIARLPAQPLRFVASRLGTNGTGRVRPETMQAWARAETRRHDWRMVVEAGWAMSNYWAPWVSKIDVPTTVLVTARDRGIKPTTQFRMAARIPGSNVHKVDDGHLVFAKPVFGTAIRAAVDDVAARLVRRA